MIVSSPCSWSHILVSSSVLLLCISSKGSVIFIIMCIYVFKNNVLNIEYITRISTSTYGILQIIIIGIWRCVFFEDELFFKRG